WLWHLTLGRRKQAERDWFTAVMAIPFSGSQQQATQRWHQLLGSVFEPLQLEELDGTEVKLQLVGEGVGMRIPASGSIKAVLLQYSHGGKRLFSSADLAFAQQLLQMLAQAEQSRASYEEGRLQ